MEDRKTYIEFLRIIASFLVIVNHTNSHVFLSMSPSATWLASVSWFLVSKIAVPIFMMISGAVLLEKRDAPRKSFSRFFRMLVVFFVCSAGCYIFYNWGTLSADSLRGFFAALFSSEGVSIAYWYLYFYLGVLLTLPLLQRMAAALSEKALRWLLLLTPGLVGTLLLCNTLTGLSFGMFWQDGFLGVYIGLLFAGLFAARHLEVTRKRFFLAAAVFLLMLVFQVAVTYRYYLRDPSDFLVLDNSKLLPITASAFCVFVMVKYLFSAAPPSPAAQRRICGLGALTFGIYLLSDPIIYATRPVYWFLGARMNLLLAALLWEALVFAICALATALLRLIPPVRKFL